MRYLVLSIKLILVVLITTLYFILYTQYSTPTHAADSSPSADIKAKLEELKAEIASKAAQLKQEINKKLQNKAYLGIVKTKSETALTLVSKNGLKMVTINQDTVYESSGKSKFSFKTLSEDNLVAALGDIDDTGVLTAKKLVLISQSKTEPILSIWGKTLTVSDETVTIKNREEKSIAVYITDETKIIKDSEEITTDQLENRDTVVISGWKDKIGNIEARTIFVLTRNNKLLGDEDISTMSAKQPASTSSITKRD